MAQSILKKWILVVALFFSVQMLAGCVYLVIGGVGAMGGYIVSPDTVEGVTENDFSRVWDSAVEVVSIMGTIKEQQEAGGMIIAKIGGTKVTISISSINHTSTKLSVKSRRSMFPKISTAQDVFVKIMTNVNQ